MSKSIHTQKHMTLSDRIYIEQALSNHDSFKDIAAVLKKDPSTISKEIRKHRRPKDGSHYHLKIIVPCFPPAIAAVYVMANFAIIFASAAKPVTAQSIARISSLIFVRNSKSLPMSAMAAPIMPADTISFSIGPKMRILLMNRPSMNADRELILPRKKELP